MKKRFSKLLIFLILMTIIATITFNSNNLSNIIVFSINVFVKNVFPSLFPMFVISSVLIELNIPYYLSKVFQKIMSYLFKCNSYGSFIFFMSMLTGAPSNAKYINDLIDKNLISEQDGNKILMFTCFSNPLFIINTIGNMFFKNFTIGVYLFIAHFLGNILTGVTFRSYNKNNDTSILKKPNNSFDIFNTLSISIKESLEILINIFGIITLFFIIINTILSTPNNFFKITLSGVLEMTSGLKYLSISNIPLVIKLYLSMFFISFGGFSIHFQIFNILKKRKIKYLPFFISRLISSIFSIIILFILLKMDMLF